MNEDINEDMIILTFQMNVFNLRLYNYIHVSQGYIGCVTCHITGKENTVQNCDLWIVSDDIIITKKQQPCTVLDNPRLTLNVTAYI